ncbi:hypothetical protein O3P69_003454 [Scylla paramamosain]|uniref:Uncharacterized protein n=1 Tax=Scylla paramamosain TaxID=85552 RepID=A0AAW0UJC2_SCYPA
MTAEAVEDDNGHMVDLCQVEVEALKDKEYQLLHECGATTTCCLLTSFWLWFTQFGIPKELSCNGGTNLRSHKAKEFFSDYELALKKPNKGVLGLSGYHGGVDGSTALPNGAGWQNDSEKQMSHPPTHQLTTGHSTGVARVHHTSPSHLTQTNMHQAFPKALRS